MSRGRNLAYSAEHNVFILETSPKVANGKGAQIWTYRYQPATSAARPAAPADLVATSDTGAVTL
jgi:hypothetical protein